MKRESKRGLVEDAQGRAKMVGIERGVVDG